MESKIAHLEMVQAVITRMAGNSFLIKGWSVTLVAALFALAAAHTNPLFVYLAYFPTFMFWRSTPTFCDKSACPEAVRPRPSCALEFSWTLDCERVLAGGVSR